MGRGLARLLLLCCCVSATAANAVVDVCYYGGPNLPNFTLNGNGKLDGTSLVVTDSIGTQKSSTSFNAPLSTAGDIRIQMKVRISQNVNGGADGITFVMHNDPAGVNALGQAGDGIGYVGITKSVVVEFDTYYNDYYNDPNANHIGVTRNGVANHGTADGLALYTPPFDLKTNTFWTWVDYTGSTKNLKVYVALSSTKPASPVINITVDVPAIVGSQMYLTFTGSTGGSWSKHEVMELLASDHTTPGAECCTGDANCVSSGLGPVCDSVKRVCGPCTLGDTTQCTAAQQSCKVSGGINACSSPCTGNLGSGGANPCTAAAFPVCATSGPATGSCVACNADYGQAGNACPAGAPVCLPNGYCGRCTTNPDCEGSGHVGNVCNTGAGSCGTCSSNAQCSGTSTCSAGRCVCNVDSDCGSNAYCQAGSCLAKKPVGQALPGGRTCPADAATVCASGRCNATTTTCAYPAGNPCTLPSQCTANLCGADQRCGCTVDGDCDSAEYCNFSTRSCVADLAPGNAIPSDGLHGGTCSDAAEVCASGICNTSTVTCAAANGATCASGAACQSNTCTSGHCVPASNGCYVDGDCTGTSYCDRATLTCTPDLGTGQPIPNDGLHDGTCTWASAVCTSTLCNSTTNTCASSNAGTCSAGNQCVSNTCKSGYCVPASNGCYVDGDCAANQFCNRSSLTCSSDLSSGQPIPNDGLHDGLCSAPNASAVCMSGACNATTNTCSAGNGVACSGPQQCTTNTCTSGYCVPSTNGCYLDGDCAGNEFCNRTSLTCTADLGAGQSIPNDGLHNGTCSAAPAVCVSGACNSTTNTCALANGSTCTAANQCTNNTCTSGHCVPSTGGCYVDSDCAGNQFCNRTTLSCTADLTPGTPIPNDGLHDGTCSTSSGLCASGLCNSATNTCAAADGATCTNANQCANNTCTSGHCVPSTNGCYVDGDCDATSHCNRGALSCEADLPAGSPIPSDTLHGGTCTDAAAVCTSGICNASTNTCALANGGVCTAANQCSNNACVSGHCVPASNGCYVDGDCATSSHCDRAALTCEADLPPGTPIPDDGLHDGTCAGAGQVCASGLCNTGTNTCAQGEGANCSAGNQCTTNVCTSGHCVPSTDGCFVDGDCPGTSYCDRATLICKVDLPEGQPIPNDGLHDGTCAGAGQVCASGLCNATTNTCGTDDGTLCTNPNECVNNTCTSSHCVPASNGCYEDVDCGAGMYCDRSTLSCAPDLAPGTPIPNDGLHDGTCSGAAEVCASGVCNTGTNTCASTPGTGCTADNQCVSNTCTSSHCVPAVNGCYVDGDCGAASHCNRTALTCAGDLPAGTPIPNDALHDGTCASAGQVCATGLCNTTTNTCAESNAASCTAANQCVNGTCTSGHCVPATNGCYVDGDCDAVSHCDRAALSCAPNLGPGAPIPDDGLHDGTCTDGNAEGVCLTDKCNPATNTCAAVDATPCTNASQCESNACTSGRCVPNVGGCYVDTDCGNNAWCNRAELLCKPQLPPGAPIPDDGLHDQGCTEENADRVCADGRCNLETGTCAQATSDTCTAASQCETNTCTSGRCVPETNGCALNTDCAGNSYCDGTSFTCKQKLGVGVSVPNDGIQSGGCNETTAAQVCETGVCNPETNACALPAQAECTTDAQCGANRCVANRCDASVKFGGGGFGCSEVPGSAAWMFGAAVMMVLRSLRRRR